MPCYYTGSAEGDARLASEEAHKQVTKLAGLLCESCLAMEKARLKMPDGTAAWWNEHKTIDKAARSSAKRLAKAFPK